MLDVSAPQNRRCGFQTFPQQEAFQVRLSGGGARLLTQLKKCIAAGALILDGSDGEIPVKLAE
jgi:hypothetical protein